MPGASRSRFSPINWARYYRWWFCRSAPWARFPHGLGFIAGSLEYTGCQSKSVQSDKLGPLLQVFDHVPVGAPHGRDFHTGWDFSRAWPAPTGVWSCACRSAPWARFPHGLRFFAGMARSYGCLGVRLLGRPMGAIFTRVGVYRGVSGIYRVPVEAGSVR